MKTTFATCTAFAMLHLVTSASVTKLPPYLKACSRKDPNLKACSLKSANDAIPSLAKGDPSLHIPVMDPLQVEQLTVEQGSGPVRIKLTITDLYLRGLKAAQFQTVDFDLEKKLIESRFTVPGQNLVLKSKYSIDGKILILPIKGDGNLTLKLDTFNGIFKSAFDLVKMSEGLLHIKLRDNSFDLDTKRVYFDFENLFNGDKTLGDNMNKFLNENSQDVFKEIKPAIAEVTRRTLLKFITGIASVLPYDVMFPE